ncbi:MAG: SOS response-associated peptidase [Pseudomonadota bacterium]
MCGRFFRESVSWEEYYTGLRLIIPDDVHPPEAAYNIAPTQFVPIIRRPTEDESGTNEDLVLEPARWGLVPGWWSKPISEIKWNTFNARAETVSDKPFFRGAFRHSRCLVPMSGYYEWQKTGSTEKQPFAIAVGNVRWFCCAGLWSRAMIDGSEIDTFTVLTTIANPKLEEIHSRMPVILSPDTYQAWLNGTGHEKDLFAPFPLEATVAWKVKPDVGNVRHQGDALIEPIE